MNEPLTSDCLYCATCGRYYIEAIGETCSCPKLPDDPNFEQDMANRWLEGELVL